MEKYKKQENIFRFLLLEYSSELFEYLFNKKKEQLLVESGNNPINTSRLSSKINVLLAKFEKQKAKFRDKIFREFNFLNKSEKNQLWSDVSNYNSEGLCLSLKGKTYLEIRDFFTEYQQNRLVFNIHLPTREIEYMFYEEKGLLKEFAGSNICFHNDISGILLLSTVTNKIEKWGRLIKDKYLKHTDSNSYKNDASKYDEKYNQIIEKLEKEVISKGVLLYLDRNGFQEIHAYGKLNKSIDAKKSTHFMRVIISRRQRNWRNKQTQHKNGYETFFHGHPISESEVRRNLGDSKKVEQLANPQNLILIEQIKIG